jgi:restriction system protein
LSAEAESRASSKDQLSEEGELAIPDYETIMLPLLQHLSNGCERKTQETLDELAERFHLTEDERRTLLPSGTQAMFTNRVAWAKFYLKRAGLVEAPKRGVYRITQTGLDLLGSHPAAIDTRLLLTIPQFRSFYLEGKVGGTASAATLRPLRAPDEVPIVAEPVKTPEEYLELGFAQIQDSLASEILQRVKEAPPEFFESLVVELLVKLGYGGSRQDAGRTVGGTGDGGIDGVINEDPLGLDRIYIQAKRWEGVVGRPEIQKFAGALQGQRANKGIFITTSSFTRDAEQFVEVIGTKIVLIDGAHLARLMIAQDVGVTKVRQYDIKRVDSDYFTQE